MVHNTRKAHTFYVEHSQIINIDRLERETRRWFYLGILLAVLIHGIMAVVWKRNHSITVETKSRPVVHLKLYSVPPQDMYMVKRPHSFLKKKYQKHRISRDNPITSPQYAPSGSTVPTLELNISERELAGESKDVHHFTIPIAPFHRLQNGFGEDIQVKRLYDHERYFSDALMDVDLLDDGHYKAMIVVDPDDRHNIKGYIHIPRCVKTIEGGFSTLNIDQFRDLVISSYTGINLKIDPPVYLATADIFKYPFLFLTFGGPIVLTDTEKTYLRRYLDNGGFIFIEAVGTANPVDGVPNGAPSVRQMIKDVYQSGNRFRMLSRDHELFHCFFDIPVTEGYDHYNDASYLSLKKQPRNYLEGVFVGDRLAVVYSEKGYCFKWGFDGLLQPEQFGVNCFVYAMKQAGGNTERLVDMSSTTAQTSRQWWDIDKRIQYRHTERIKR